MNFRKVCILLLVILPAVLATDYCKPGLCRGNKRHVACGKNEFAVRCGDIKKTVTLTPADKAYIVNKHNMLRNQIAQGFDEFLSAAHMATMEWDEELAYLADLNVRQCDMKHDECRSTDRFPYSGQNLASMKWKNYSFNFTELIDDHMNRWFDEYKHCPSKYVQKYPEKYRGKAIGHFTAMVQEKNNRVGCAAWRGVQEEWDAQYFACNYAYTNILDEPVYKPGPAASDCKTRVNPNFTSLCSTHEIYDLKNVY